MNPLARLKSTMAKIETAEMPVGMRNLKDSCDCKARTSVVAQAFGCFLLLPRVGFFLAVMKAMTLCAVENCGGRMPTLVWKLGSLFFAHAL
jgi:hypothetical protein